jgi:hypothetical protein
MSKNIFNSRPHDIFKAVISKECGTECRKNTLEFKCVSYMKECLPCIHLGGHWIGGRLLKAKNA